MSPLNMPLGYFPIPPIPLKRSEDLKVMPVQCATNSVATTCDHAVYVSLDEYTASF